MGREKLRQVNIWLNEEQYEELKREAERNGSTVYRYVKALTLKRKLAFRLMVSAWAITGGMLIFVVWFIYMVALTLSQI